MAGIARETDIDVRVGMVSVLSSKVIKGCGYVSVQT